MECKIDFHTPFKQVTWINQLRIALEFIVVLSGKYQRVAFTTKCPYTA